MRRFFTPEIAEDAERKQLPGFCFFKQDVEGSQPTLFSKQARTRFVGRLHRHKSVAFQEPLAINFVGIEHGKSMIIRSSDQDCSITIVPGDYSDPQNYSVALSAHDFSGANPGIFFVNAEQFLSEIRQLAQNRRGKAILEGSEDFSLICESYGSLGALWVQLRLARVIYFQGSQGVRSSNYSLNCAFDIEGEYVNDLVRDFEHLFLPPT